MKKIIIFCFILIINTLQSCTSTKISSSWRDTDKHIHSNEWNKILVVSLLKNETNRRKAEDEMVKYLKGKGIASYQYLNESYHKIDEEELRIKIKKDGFNGAITMRLIDVDKEKVYVPGERHLYPDYYHNFSRYCYRNWVYYTTPDYFVVTKTYIIETVIYSIEDDKIIWSGITEAFDPQSVKKMTNEIAKVIYKKMIEEGFIKED